MQTTGTSWTDLKDLLSHEIPTYYVQECEKTE